MGIFDEAIREHLELKRQQGAGDSELRELEDDAFGPAARPGESPVAEAPAAVGDEALPAETELLAGLQEAPPEPAQTPPDEEHPAMEHSTVDPGDDDAGTVAVETEEHPPPEPVEGAEEIPEPVDEAEDVSIADQPTELYDVGDEAPVEKAPVEDSGEPVEDEFFSEQSLSDELDQALDAPETEQGLPPEPSEEPPEPAVQEEELPSEPAVEKGEPSPGEPEGDFDDESEEGEDVLEETPEFLQDTPEHDRLWFEQKPPKDFDFDD
jgi:hypothetical protein